MSTYNRVYQSFLNLLKPRATTHYKDLKLYSVQCACTVWDYDNILLYHGVDFIFVSFFLKATNISTDKINVLLVCMRNYNPLPPPPPPANIYAGLCLDKT